MRSDDKELKVVDQKITLLMNYRLAAVETILHYILPLYSWPLYYTRL
jgi:hypothetical protein